MALVILYGEGGFDINKPNNNIVDQYHIPDTPVDEKELLRKSALAKLTALGLTEDEAKAIAGV